ncbi:hypothetical protein G7Y89_g7381 [Cudoniella acicularis]|uniref:Major facilitator superfamily (MFS) profile domain-containing protein n=1 Tax=Cudoniella acicularis TaxID=354080 RepID=A0A8H4RM66_9HELO|nr:hypothetical protein G7Y89_g7381 [Cudoniella acicularis]
MGFKRVRGGESVGLVADSSFRFVGPRLRWHHRAKGEFDSTPDLHDYYEVQDSSDSLSTLEAPGNHCRILAVQSQVAIFKLLCSLISGSIAAVVVPKLGKLLDRYGRKPLLLCAIAGMLANEVVTILAATFSATASVNWIIFGSVFDGLGDRRNVVFGYFHGCLYMGIAAGPILSGYFVLEVRLIYLQRGYLGMGPKSSQPGDQVWLLRGGNIPFILRPLENGNYRPIRGTYVHGAMRGEALKGKDNKFQEILIE